MSRCSSLLEIPDAAGKRSYTVIVMYNDAMAKHEIVIPHKHVCEVLGLSHVNYHLKSGKSLCNLQMEDFLVRKGFQKARLTNRIRVYSLADFCALFAAPSFEDTISTMVSSIAREVRRKHIAVTHATAALFARYSDEDEEEDEPEDEGVLQPFVPVRPSFVRAKRGRDEEDKVMVVAVDPLDIDHDIDVMVAALAVQLKAKVRAKHNVWKRAHVEQNQERWRQEEADLHEEEWKARWISENKEDLEEEWIANNAEEVKREYVKDNAPLWKEKYEAAMMDFVQSRLCDSGSK